MNDEAASGGGADGVQPDKPDPAADAKDQKDDKADEDAEEEEEQNKLGGQSRDFRQAYDRGRVSLRGPGSTYFGAGRDVHVSETINVMVGRGVGLAPGPVRPEDLERIRSRYSQIAEYDGILAMLVERKLVLLCGFPDTGRATTALRVLDEVAHGTVFRLGIEDLTSIAETDLKDGGGYLIDLTQCPSGQSLAEPQLDRLSNVLGKCGSFGVVLTERHHGSLDGYLHNCSPPDPDMLLRRHLIREIRDDDEEKLEGRLLELSAQPRLRDAIGPRPRPVETLAFARLLVEHGRGTITLEDVEADCAELIRRQVVEWFAGLRGLRRSDAADHALRLASFMIALAVFNGSPYYIVREAGERLALDLMRTLWPKRVPGRPLTGDDREPWLAAARAKLVDGYITKGSARVPSQQVEFEDMRFPHAVLSHVWLTHHNLREPLRRWLTEQSRDPRDFIWVRAAQAAGLLCALDFPYTFHDMLAPAAESKDVLEREFAAVAVDQAALDDQVRPIVTAHLKSWVRGTPELQCTVANTLGYEVGLASVEKSLNWLRILGTRTETKSDMAPTLQRRLVWISGKSMAKLFASGAAAPVLDMLGEWIKPRERLSLHELAAWTILEMASFYVDDLLHANALLRREHRVPAKERKNWPALLALQEDDTELTTPIADLLRHALRSRHSDLAEEVLEGWLRAGEDDESCVDALAEFMPNLVHIDGDRRRLRRLITKMRRDWAYPLDNEVATRLEAALDHILILEVAR